MKKPRTAKSAKKPAAPRKVKPTPTEAARAAAGHNSVDPKVRELFLQHQPKVDRLLAAVKSATGKLRAAYKEAKADGFEKLHFDIARQVSTPEGEDDYKRRLRKELTAAQFVGATFVNQLDLFMADEPDRTDSLERAYDEGQKQSMEGGKPKPDYAPATAQHEAWLKGYQDHQAGVAKGFQSIDKGAKTATEKAREAKAAKAEAKANGNGAPPQAEETATQQQPATPPTSGVPLSRAEYTRQQQAALAAAGGQPQSQFSKRN